MSAFANPASKDVGRSFSLLSRDETIDCSRILLVIFYARVDIVFHISEVHPGDIQRMVEDPRRIHDWARECGTLRRPERQLLRQDAASPRRTAVQ